MRVRTRRCVCPYLVLTAQKHFVLVMCLVLQFYLQEWSNRSRSHAPHIAFSIVGNNNNNNKNTKLNGVCV